MAQLWEKGGKTEIFLRLDQKALKFTDGSVAACMVSMVLLKGIEVDPWFRISRIHHYALVEISVLFTADTHSVRL